MDYTERFKKICQYTLMGFGIGLVIGIVIGILSKDFAAVIASTILIGSVAALIISTKSGLPGAIGTMGVNWIIGFFKSMIRGLMGGDIMISLFVLFVKLIVMLILIIPIAIYLATSYILNFLYFGFMALNEKKAFVEIDEATSEIIDKAVSLAVIVITAILSIIVLRAMFSDSPSKKKTETSSVNESVNVVADIENDSTALDVDGDTEKEAKISEELNKENDTDVATEQSNAVEETTVDISHAAEYSCAIDSLKDNGDGTYTLIGSYVYETVPSDMTEEEYNALSLGCEFPVDSYYKDEGFHCVEATEEGFFFVDSYIESLDEVYGEDTTLKVVKDGDKIKIYWQCLNSAYGEEWRLAENFDKRIGDCKEFIITQDTTFTLISGLGSERNGYVPNYEDPVAVKDIGMDNVYGYYYNAEFMDDSYPGWHGIESVTVTTDDDGKVIDIREHLQAG